jgi:hypothetical protein
MRDYTFISLSAMLLIGLSEAQATESCQTVVDRYRTLPPQKDESPLSALHASKQGGITLSKSVMYLPNGVPDLLDWAASQTPAVDLPEPLRDQEDLFELGGSINTLEQLPGTGVYAVNVVAGTGHCYTSQYFEIRQGKLRMLDEPPGFREMDGKGCMANRSFGTLDGTPVLFEEYYGPMPPLKSTLTIATWGGDRFVAGCRAIFEYEPELTQKVWTEPGRCNGDHCASLHAAALQIVTAIQKDPQQAYEQLTASLSKTHAVEYARAEKAAGNESGKSTQEATDPDEITRDWPFRVPYVNGGKLYLVSAGHFAVGWRYSEDWSVAFHEIAQDQRIERGVFAIGMSKGRLKRTAIEAF